MSTTMPPAESRKQNHARHARTTSEHARRSELRVEIEAAKLRLILDERLGRETPQWVKDLAHKGA
jgi:hypothetical protein